MPCKGVTNRLYIIKEQANDLLTINKDIALEGDINHVNINLCRFYSSYLWTTWFVYKFSSVISHLPNI